MGKQQRKARIDKTSRQRQSRSKPTAKGKISSAHNLRVGKANAHGDLADNFVHVFVDDQNLFWGIVNERGDLGFRVDFGELLTEVSKDSKGKSRAIKSAYIAGVIPDDDSFWKIAENQGFVVRRGYLGANGRSKQDDAYLITDLTATLYEQAGPSTIVLVAGDADYVPPLIKSLEKGWRNEVAFINRGASAALDLVVHEFRVIDPSQFQHVPRGYSGRLRPDY